MMKTRRGAMMSRWLTLCVGMVFCFQFSLLNSAQAQGRGRPWKRGSLRLDDFGVIAAPGRENSHLDYALTYSPAGLTEGGNTYLFCRTSAVMYPTASWMAEGHADERELAYNQMLFDLVEVYRRQMQRQSMLLTKRGQYEMLLASTKEQLDREMQTLRIATDEGRDTVMMERIRVKNREWLNDNPCERPVFELRRYWWRVDMTYGFDIPTGVLADHYTASIGSQTYMYAMGFGRHGFYYQVLSGNLQTYDTVYGVSPVDHRADITFGYGYTLFDRPAFSITPYLSYGLTEFYWWAGVNYTFGVRGDYHFHHWHRITNAVKHKGKRYTASATANLYLSYIDLGDNDRNGLSLGLHVGLSFLSRSEKVTW